MKRSDTIRLFCYVAALAFILFYPVRKIWQFTFPEGKGTEYRIPVTAYDPYDPMRGRYVRLNLSGTETVRLPKKNAPVCESGVHCFALLEKAPDGTIRIVDLAKYRSEFPPGVDVLSVEYRWFTQDYEAGGANRRKVRSLKTGKHHIRLPFERFYLNERKAPEVEKLLQKRGSKAELIVIVYPNGIYRVKDLIVNGKAVRGR